MRHFAIRGEAEPHPSWPDECDVNARSVPIDSVNCLLFGPPDSGLDHILSYTGFPDEKAGENKVQPNFLEEESKRNGT